MRALRYISLLAVIGSDLKAQLPDTFSLADRKVRALICADGTWGFHGVPALEYEQQAISATLLQKLSFWVSARRSDGTMTAAVSDVFSDSGSYKPGPLKLQGAGAASPQLWNRVFTLTSAEIETHRHSFRASDYAIPESLETWPGNGPQGCDLVLAPYADFDNNGTYNPKQGDYPYVAGSACAYTIANDDAQTGANPLGIEVQQLARLFSSEGQLPPALLLRFTVHNRSLQDYKAVRLTMAADFSIGSNADDYLMTDVTHRALVAYNGVESDKWYGKNAPACALMLLNRSIGATMYFESGNDAVKGRPVKVNDYIQLARGCWKTGRPLAFGNAGLDGSMPTKFIYSNGTDLNFPEVWNEWSAANFPGRRTGLISTDSFDLRAGASVILEAAVAIVPEVGNDPDKIMKALESQALTASRLLAFQGADAKSESGLFEVRGRELLIQPSINGQPVQLDFYRMNGARLASYCFLNAGLFNLKSLPEEGIVLLVATSGNQTFRALIHNTEP